MADLIDRLARALDGRYVIERQLGRGGMATVFLARDVKHDRDVAIKVLHPELSAAVSGERFHREIHIQARLRHPHVVTLLDSGDADGLLYYVMTYVEGESLRQRLARGPLDVPEATRLWREVIDGIAYAHRHGVLHRDIKPENILLTEGHALVADFGVAKVLEHPTAGGSETLTGFGIAIGTPAYMAPEQRMALDDVDHRADIYALGVVGREMFGDRAPHVSPVIERCLQRDPEHRWPSADELLAALDSVATDSGRVTGFAASRRARRGLIVAGAVLLVIAVGSAFALNAKRSRTRWAREVALPEIRRLVDARITDSAYLLTTRARQALGDDPELQSLWRRVSTPATVHTRPADARVSWMPFRGDTSQWHQLGTAPLDSFAVPVLLSNQPSYPVLKFEAPGFVTAMIPVSATRGLTEPIVLDSVIGADTTMVRVPAMRVLLSTGDGRARTVRMDAFTIDKRETSNEEYKKFVDAGGYADEALRGLVDRTGRPGPATWEGGTYPLGEEKVPVGGVSWHEAAAYAKFAGKSLPTVHQWRAAAGFPAAAWIVPRSTMETKHARAVGSGGMGPYGTFDMAGNLREWCLNAEVSDRGSRHVLGGAWTDPPWAFFDRALADPHDRSPTNGIRLVRALAGSDSNATALAAPIVRGVRDYARERPVSEAEFRTLARLYDYDHTPLNVRVESVDSSDSDYVRETITFDAAYGTDRVRAHLVRPRRARPPYQAVVVTPGGNAFTPGPSEVMLQLSPYIVASGRAVLYPVMKNTFERIDDRVSFASGPVHNMSGELLGPNAYRDEIVMMMKDLRRSVDYLATRGDIDIARLAYVGHSWGARIGPIAVAVEPRFRASVFYVGGLMTAPRLPAVDEFNFLPRVRVPALLLSGRYDDTFPLDRFVQPYFALLGAPRDRKRHMVYPTQHFVPRDQQIAETLNWLDRYLGPVGVTSTVQRSSRR